MTRPAAAGAGRSRSVRCSLTESLEQLAAASQKLADIAAEALGPDDAEPVRDLTEFATDIEAGRRTLTEKFDPRNIEGYDGSDAMEKARSAHLEAALEMYTVMVEASHQDSDLASKIGDSLFKELKEYYRTTQHANERVIFTTEQRNALESAFLLKPKLNTAEKKALAKTCNLNPRQVEVWVCALLLWFTGANLILISFRIVGHAKSGRRKGRRSVEVKLLASHPARPRMFEVPNEPGGLSASASEQRQRRKTCGRNGS